MQIEEVYSIAFRAFKDALTERLASLDDEVEIAPKFYRGKLILAPENSSHQPKEIDLDVFFRKIVSVRNNLRVMEQKINSSTKLEEAEKVELQGYLTRSYGSLTTFNILFKEDADKFIGSKAE